MNLLNNIFNVDRIEVMEVNKKSIMIVLVLLIITVGFLVIKKNCYYINTITKVGEKIVLVVDKNHLKKIQEQNRIIINDTENEYSINNIEVLDEVNFVYIDLKDSIEIENNNTYKIYLGKEKLLEYIVRIIKN